MSEVTLNPDLANCAADYARRCESIGGERHKIIDLQHAMSHPQFKERHHALLNELANEYRQRLPLLERPARFTLKLGVYGTKENMLKSVTDKGHKFTYCATRVIASDRFLMLDAPGEYEFIQTTAKEVSGKNSPTITELRKAMHRLGFIDAPHESAPAIREIYNDQPMDEWCAVLSKPIADSNGDANILNVARHSGGSCVGRYFAHRGLDWDGDTLLLVCRKL